MVKSDHVEAYKKAREGLFYRLVGGSSWGTISQGPTQYSATDKKSLASTEEKQESKSQTTQKEETGEKTGEQSAVVPFDFDATNSAIRQHADNVKYAKPFENLSSDGRELQV